MIINLIKSGYGISFVYEVLAKSDPELGIFTLKGEPIVREFNVIYLKHADVREKMEWFLLVIILKINPMGHQIVLKELLFLKLYQKEKRIYEK